MTQVNSSLSGPAKDLNAKIRAFIDGWNSRCYPFFWTTTSDQILAEAKRPTTINYSQ